MRFVKLLIDKSLHLGFAGLLSLFLNALMIQCKQMDKKPGCCYCTQPSPKKTMNVLSDI